MFNNYGDGKQENTKKKRETYKKKSTHSDERGWNCLFECTYEGKRLETSAKRFCCTIDVN